MEEKLLQQVNQLIATVDDFNIEMIGHTNEGVINAYLKLLKSESAELMTVLFNFKTFLELTKP